MPPTAQQQSAGHAGRLLRFNTRVEWFGDQLTRNLDRTIKGRLQLASMLLRDRVVINLSKPVVKIAGGGGRRTRVDPSSRSKPGEFPRADTTRLMKDIFFQVDKNVGRVGTTLDYCLILETRMDRSFLVRTLHEFSPQIRRILTAPV